GQRRQRARAGQHLGVKLPQWPQPRFDLAIGGKGGAHQAIRCAQADLDDFSHQAAVPRVTSPTAPTLTVTLVAPLTGAFTVEMPTRPAKVHSTPPVRALVISK